ncbi:MAG TPA: hypothetical protein VGG03_24345 [Thermoanaerobaculia bacterium]
MKRTRWFGTGMASLALAYFAFYAPYSALANALARGALSPDGQRIPGLLLLPAATLGTLLGVALFLGLSGWLRHARRRRLAGVEVPFPGTEVLTAAFWHAVVIGATTLNYTFPGVSILFVLLLMRGGVLVLSPIVDALRRRTVQRSSWVALGLSLAAVTVALSDVDHYRLSLGAALSLAAYLTGYAVRFHVMAGAAKSHDPEVNRRFFVEEQMASSPFLMALLAVGALAAPGAVAGGLRQGFTSFLLTPLALPALLVGVLYAGLSFFGSLIYVHHREFTFCVPFNRAASLLAGVVATYGLSFLIGLPPPSAMQLTAAGLVLLALAVLTRPELVERRLATAPGASGGRLFLFVCSGNTCRSPMAEAIARAELAQRFGRRSPLAVTSAGLAPEPGAGMTREAEVALREIGVEPGRHRARPLTPELVERAEAVYCMTAAQREAVLRKVPAAAGKTWCLDPEGDVPDPIGSAPEVYLGCARRLRGLVQWRLDESLAGA